MSDWTSLRQLDHTVATATQVVPISQAKSAAEDWNLLSTIVKDRVRSDRYRKYANVMMSRVLDIINDLLISSHFRDIGYPCFCLRVGKITDEDLPYDRTIAPYGLDGLLANRNCNSCRGAGRLSRDESRDDGRPQSCRGDSQKMATI